MAFLGSMIAPYAGLALLTWVYLQPALERCTEFQFDWVVQIFLRNLFLLVVIAGGLHLYLFTFKRQRQTRKFDARQMHTDNPKFFARSDVYLHR